MKLRTYVLMLAALMAVGLSSCTTICPANEGQTVFFEEGPKSVTKKVADYNSVVVLGYNSTMGMETEDLDEYMGGSKLGLSDTNDFLLSNDVKVEFAEDLPYPIGEKINGYESTLLSELENAKFTLIDKDTLLSTKAYQKVSKPIRDEEFAESGLASVNVAEGYNTTFRFPDLMNNTETVVNSFKASLEESGADFGVIVAERPYLRVHNNHGLVKEFMTKCTPYYTVATKNTYYLIQPKTMNQVLYAQTFVAESGNRHLLENAEENPLFRKGIYTQEMVEEDKTTWMEEVTAASTEAHKAFVKWLDSLKEE
ncbi:MULTISPECIES: hypothetical protein [unclassified Oceanispirochaeta]|uniref:hypothetical protein n=1 Tax=unclassified Oceanispirochaeta TaxID=2635722 RepID=UPI000E08F855|nr:MULTISPECIES: hypothetical protein [unclassified Oceanispirochaeta]MBF9016372.1 hypothetical protein [Oceanispirochaeta sp. M2]NPD72834.1 hypothetical protein [Oceanispirochaeta sp. M1]RDG31678.1 hypothetical protein DV872_12050 [Oceanispirochaeta sp. M1]